MKEYKIISGDHVESILDVLNQHGRDNWTVSFTVTEHGYTKIILERETS